MTTFETEHSGSIPWRGLLNGVGMGGGRLLPLDEVSLPSRPGYEPSRQAAVGWQALLGPVLLLACQLQSLLLALTADPLATEVTCSHDKDR